VTQLLAAGGDAQARIQTVLLAALEIAPEGMAKLAHASALRKPNPDWPNQQRNPAGSREGGQWTSGPAGHAEGANVQPVAAQTNDI